MNDIKEELKNEALRIYEIVGSLKKDEYAKYCKKGLGIPTYRKYFKSHNEFLQYCGIPINKVRDRTKEEVDREILRLFQLAKAKNEKFSNAFWRKYANFTLKPVCRIYETFDNAVEKFVEIKLYNEDFVVTEEKVINDIIYVHELSLNLNEKFNLRFYQKHTKYSLFYLCHYFYSYQDAVEKLNLTNNILPTPTRNEYLNEIKELYKEYGYVSISLLGSESKFKCKGLRYLKEFGGLINILDELGIPHHQKEASKSARQVIHYISEFLQEEPIFEKTWDWLKNPKTNYNLFADAFFPNNNLVVEYHGMQHYIHNDYFHKNFEDFLSLQYNDKMKKKLILEKNINFIEIPYKEKRNYENIVKIIKENLYN